MSAFDDDQRTERNLFSIMFRATTRECREIYRQLLERPEWLEWSTTDDLVKCGTFDATSEAGIDLASRQNVAYRKMARLTLDAVDRLERERSG